MTVDNKRKGNFDYGWPAGLQRELSAGAAYIALLVVMAFFAREFFSINNLKDLVLNNIAVLVVAIGMTLVILTRHIDISVGSQFAVCSIAAGVLAKAGLNIFLVLLLVTFIGAGLGAINGILTARLKIPSIVVTLAMMVILRDILRWTTEGQWISGLPADFQWFGFGQSPGQAIIFTITSLIFLIFLWALKYHAFGRSIYAVGSDEEAARLAGLPSNAIVFGVFVITGLLTGLAALLNAVRFNEIPGNAGTGLELKTIAAVVVGGTAISGGRGTLTGTLIGVILLGTIGTALIYLGVNPYWEKSIQGVVILAAIASEAIMSRQSNYGKFRYAKD